MTRYLFVDLYEVCSSRLSQAASFYDYNDECQQYICSDDDYDEDKDDEDDREHTDLTKLNEEFLTSRPFASLSSSSFSSQVGAHKMMNTGFKKLNEVFGC